MALKILAVTSEAYPLAKTGGLGDAVSGMAGAIQAAGTDVTLMLPAYRGVRRKLSHARLTGRLKGLPGGDANLVSGYSPDIGVDVLLVENDALYDRDGLYVDASGNEHHDSAVRFAALAHAAARVAAGSAGLEGYDVVHAHDWHAALVPAALRQLGAAHVPTVLTLHNLAFQGCFDLRFADQIGFDEEVLRSAGVSRGDHLNFLHSGILSADKITVVSKNYAREILTPEFGCGLEQLLQTRRCDMFAVANGIDTSVWNPATDVHLRKCHFDVSDMSNKVLCKQRLQGRFGLTTSADATVLGMGSRLTGQKMADVAARALPLALEAHPELQVCIIGCGEKHIEMQLRELAERYPGRCAVHIGYSEDIAHLLHAGSDILLHGSRFEPFGLTPLYAMRYGTIPIGSRVGGMVDTIRDPGASSEADAMRRATGLLFDGDSEHAMYEAIERALALKQSKQVWRSMQLNAMRANFSWSNAAPAYLQCYRELCREPALDMHRQPAPARVPAHATPVLNAARQMGRTAGSRIQGLGLSATGARAELTPIATTATAA